LDASYLLPYDEANEIPERSKLTKQGRRKHQMVRKPSPEMIVIRPQRIFKWWFSELGIVLMDWTETGLEMEEKV